MTGILELDQGPNENLVKIGENNKLVSIKDYQDIYHQITGRTEQIRKRYTELLKIDFNEIKQLHTKIIQLCDVHNIVAKNLSISVFHKKERKEQFTSFERFETYNSNTTSPTLSVVLKYNFSIIPAGIEKTQEYVISIVLNSKISIIEEMQDEAPAFIRNNMMPFTNQPIAEIKIDYVDYVIARGFIESFEEWVDGCNKGAKNKMLSFAQEYSYQLRRVLRISSVIIIAYTALQLLSSHDFTQASQEYLARLLVFFLAGGVILHDLFTFIGHRLERLIDGYPECTYLNLNKGDQKVLDNFIKKKSSTSMKFFSYCALNIILAIVATKLGKLL